MVVYVKAHTWFFSDKTDVFAGSLFIQFVEPDETIREGPAWIIYCSNSRLLDVCRGDEFGILNFSTRCKDQSNQQAGLPALPLRAPSPAPHVGMNDSSQLKADEGKELNSNGEYWG